jgi:tRNA (adenine57-N1/adenine58-N1)-methyltransferase
MWTPYSWTPNPYDYLLQARRALKPGGYFGTILPTVNQITRLLDAFYQYDYAFVDVCEIMLRYYKTVSERFRPTDRMVAHTGYLAFARPMLASYNKSEPAIPPDAEQEGSSLEDEAESWAEHGSLE